MKKVFLVVLIMLVLSGCGTKEQKDENISAITVEASEEVAEEKKELTDQEKYAVQVINRILDKIDDPSSLKVYSIEGTSDIKAACGTDSVYEMYQSCKMEYVVKMDVSYANDKGGTDRFKSAWGYVGTDVGFGKDCITDFMAGLEMSSTELEELDVEKVLENSDYYKYVK